MAEKRDGAAGERAKAGADEALFPMIYDELHRLAEGYLRRQSPGHTLQPTALVHEAYLRLADRTAGLFKDRAHFVAVGATAMRSILVDHARARAAQKRGGGFRRITLHESVTAAPEQEVDLLALDEALDRLAELDPRRSRVVELRFFAGLTIEEAADVLEVSHMTVSKDWRLARAWIAEAIGEPGGA